jgi:hypothetical protein
VPRRWAEDPGLGKWVGKQRNYKKALDRGDPGKGMAAARAAKLEALSLTWDALDAAWEAQLAKLAVYKVAHGDCNVPRRWAEDPGLGKWVGKKRNYKTCLDRGDHSKGMTAARVAKLEAFSLAWAENIDMGRKLGPKIWKPSLQLVQPKKKNAKSERPAIPFQFSE